MGRNSGESKLFQNQGGKVLVGISFIKPCLHLEDFHYCQRTQQHYWSVEVLRTVVTVVAGGVVVENLNAPSN